MPSDPQCIAPRLRLEHAARLLDAACARDGLSNVQLARYLKVGRDAVSKQRKGTQWLEVPPLLALASLVQVPPAHLFPDDPASTFSQLVQVLAALTPEAQAKLLPLIKEFVALLKSRC